MVMMKNNIELPAHIQYIIKQMRDTSTRKELRANYCTQLEDLRNLLDKEITEFKNHTA